MLKRALISLALVGAFALAPFAARSSSAWADTPEDAGAGSGAAAGPADTAASPPAAAAPAAPECTYKGVAMPCEQLAAKFSEHPVDAVSTVTTLWKGGAIIPAIILGLFGLLYWASKHIAWLTKDHRAAYTASALGGLTLLAEPASRGTTPTLGMVLGALGAAFLLFTNAKKPAQTTAGQAPS